MERVADKSSKVALEKRIEAGRCVLVRKLLKPTKVVYVSINTAIKTPCCLGYYKSKEKRFVANKGALA